MTSKQLKQIPRNEIEQVRNLSTHLLPVVVPNITHRPL